jgi:hypothetical protein
MLTAKELADRLVELYNDGKALQAEEELYADDVVSHEQQEGAITQGKAAVMAKTKAAFEGITTVHKNVAHPALINNDTFLIKFEVDLERASGRMGGTEYGFYQVKDGKVAVEYFYFEV